MRRISKDTVPYLRRVGIEYIQEYGGGNKEKLRGTWHDDGTSLYQINYSTKYSVVKCNIETVPITLLKQSS